MRPLPPPGTFAEGQRLVYGLLAAAAGMFCGACAIAMVALLMWGRWSPQEEHSIVVIFGWSLGGFIAAMVAVIVGLLAGGPVGRFRLAAGREGDVLTATGRPLHVGRRTQVWEVRIHKEEGRNAAFFTCTQLILTPA